MRREQSAIARVIDEPWLTDRGGERAQLVITMALDVEPAIGSGVEPMQCMKPVHAAIDGAIELPFPRHAPLRNRVGHRRQHHRLEILPAPRAFTRLEPDHDRRRGGERRRRVGVGAVDRIVVVARLDDAGTGDGVG